MAAASSGPEVVPIDLVIIDEFYAALRNREVEKVAAILKSNNEHVIELFNALGDSGIIPFCFMEYSLAKMLSEPEKEVLKIFDAEQKILELLLQYEADVNAETNEGEYVLSMVLKDYSFILKYHFQKLSPIYQRPLNLSDSLANFLVTKFKEIIAMLSKAGAKVKAALTYEMLLNASACGYLDIVKECLAINKSLVSPKILNAALFQSSSYGRLDIVIYLIELGADVKSIADEESSRYATPLHFAAANGHLEVVKELIRCGSSIDPIDVNNNTPLLSAIENGQLEVAKFLLRNGANLHAKDSFNCGAAFFVGKSDDLNMLKFVIERLSAAEINMESKYGATPLSEACRLGKLHAVNFLLAKGAYIYAERDDGRNALKEACFNNHPEIVALLLPRVPGELRAPAEVIGSVIFKLLFAVCNNRSDTEKSYLKVVQELLKYTREDINYKLLIFAAKRTHKDDVVEYLNDILSRRNTLHALLALRELCNDDSQSIPEHLYRDGTLQPILRAALKKDAEARPR